jgi:hypothetical protein
LRQLTCWMPGMSKHAFTYGMRVQQLCSCSLLPREYIGLVRCEGWCSWIAWNRALRPRKQVVPMTLPRQRCERSSISVTIHKAAAMWQPSRCCWR